MNKNQYILTIVLCISTLAFGGKLKKGFEALEIYNYFAAKKTFEKAAKKHPVAANFGLSIIYQRQDNPFHNIDSAYNLITYSALNYSQLSSKSKDKYLKLGIDSLKIFKQRNKVSYYLFERAITVNSEFGFQDFIDKNPWNENIESAIFYRDSLYYHEVLSTHKSKDFRKFMDKYPKSHYYDVAKTKYERQLYVEQTKRGYLMSYINFINNNPKNPFVIDAENRIYEIETASKTASSYEDFINQYPENNNILVAWQQLYNAFLTENITGNAISDFITRYPKSPYKKQVERELELSNTYFYPIQSNGIWTFVAEDISFKIKGNYDFVEPFSEGLAAVTVDDKVGYISKMGEMKIPLKYDEGLAFSEGFAIVEYEGAYGMINRNGEYILKPEYTYLGVLKNGLVSFENKNGKFGFFDRKGFVKIKPTYDDVFDFEKNHAKVKEAEKWGLINSYGQVIYECRYEKVKSINDSIYALRDDYWGALNMNKDTIIDFMYDYIGEYSNGYHLVTKNDSFNYISMDGVLLLNELWHPTYPEFKILAKYMKQPILIPSEDGYNYLNSNGKKIFKYGKAQLGGYSKLIAYNYEDQWGYLSPVPPKQVIKPIYDKAYSFRNNFGIVSLNPFWGLIDTNGNVIVKVMYEDLQFINDTLLIATTKGRKGILSVSNDTILPFIYDEIELYQPNVVSIREKDSFSYYNFATNKWIRKENE